MFHRGLSLRNKLFAMYLLVGVMFAGAGVLMLSLVR